MATDEEVIETGTRNILVFACTKTGISRTTRPLRARGCQVQACSSCEDALDRFRDTRIDLLLVERDDTDRRSIDFLCRLRNEGLVTPSVLVTPLDPEVLLAAVNDARVSRVVSATQDLQSILEKVLAAPEGTELELPQIEGLRSRCAMLEDKIDTLVRDGIQRDGAARLLHDILVEIGHASGVRELAGRCLARVVTMLRLDMALIVLATPRKESDQAIFSFGCPRVLLDHLREIKWGDLIAALGNEDVPRPLSEVVGDRLATLMTKSMQVEGAQGLVLFPLRARDTTLGYLGLGDRERRISRRFHAEQLKPVVKQIAIAIENSRLVETAAAAEAFATSVLQHLPSTVVVCDASGRILRSYDDKLGLFSGRATPGALLSDLLPAHETGVLQDQIAGVSGGGDSISLRALHLTLPSGDRLLNVSLAPLAGRDVMILLDDITHRESVAGDLRRARALTSSLFAKAPAGVLFLRHNGDIIDINNTACEIFHCQRTEIINKNMELLYPDLWRALTLEATGGRGEATFRVGENTRATVSFSTTRLGRPDGPAGILLQVQDMGELQALREEVRRKDNLALMGQMVSFVAHEIKNPLFGISSTAQVLAREVGTAESNRLSNLMLSEIDRLAQLLEDLLVFGNKRAIDPMEGDPTEVCSEVATMHRAALTQRGVALELELKAPTTPVFFDPARLRQVVLNLVGNAIDATPQGGAISIAGETVGADYVIKVANTGEPIPAPDLERIFDLFYTTKSGGTGLGLPICKKIVEDHGGRIVVESAPGQRTVFAVCIPAQRGGVIGTA